MNDQVYTLEFDGRAGDHTDVQVQQLIRTHGGDITGAGTLLAANPMRRDIEFVIPADRAQVLLIALRLMGIEPRAKVH